MAVIQQPGPEILLGSSCGMFRIEQSTAKDMPGDERQGYVCQTVDGDQVVLNHSYGLYVLNGNVVLY